MLMDLQRNMQELRREKTEMKQSLEGLKSRLDEVQEAVNGIEIREQERREADAERKGSPGMKEYEQNCVANSNGTIFAL